MYICIYIIHTIHYMNDLENNNGSGIFIQIGAGAGDLDSRANNRDGFAEFIKKIPKSRIKQIILVEPNMFNIKLLEESYKNYLDVVTIIEKLIVPTYYENKRMDLYYCEDDAPHYQTASIDKEHILKHYPNHTLKNIEVECTTLENIYDTYIKNKEIELLSLDIEGVDSKIILDLNFEKINIEYLSFEYIHLNNKTEEVKNHLIKNNFIFKGNGIDHSGLDWLYKKKRIYPINFSFPSILISKEKSQKKKILSDLIPGVLSTYIFETQDDYYNEYKKSMFAITKKKDGWDCERHYEIIFNNCLPIFENIESCPKNIMTLLPKDLLFEINNFYNSIKNKEFYQLNYQDWEIYNSYNKVLFDHCINNVTSIKIAEYILNKTNNNNAEKILYLSNDPMPDYLRCLTLIGFKEKFKSNCHDYVKVEHIYKDIKHNFNYKKMSSKGFTYSSLFNYNEYRDDNLDKSIENDIINNYYDVIIYGSINRGSPPFIELVKNKYENNKIIFLDGDDHTDIMYKDDSKYNLFIRELYV